jgi:hypothetical protein
MTERAPGFISVHPTVSGAGSERCSWRYQGRIARRGSSGSLVSAAGRSAPFWEKIGFVRLPVVLMLTEFKPD